MKNLRKEAREFMVVGLGKGGRKFYHFKQEDQFNMKLVPEPENKYDKYAIKVYVNDKHVAYVSRQDAPFIGLFLKRKKHIHAFYLIDKYNYSVRFLIVDLTLSLKRRK